MKRFLISAIVTFSLSTPAWAQYAAVGNQSGVSTAASQLQQHLDSSSKMNLMMGSLLLAMCLMPSMSGGGSAKASSGSTASMLVCMMGGLTLAQGMSQQQQAKQAAATLASSNLQSTSTVILPGSIAPAVLPLPAVANATAVNNGLQVLASSGYQITSSGVRMPNGTVYPASALSSPSSMAAMGFDPAAIREAMAISNNASNEATRRLQQSGAQANN